MNYADVASSVPRIRLSDSSNDTDRDGKGSPSHPTIKALGENGRACGMSDGDIVGLKRLVHRVFQFPP